MNFIAECYVKLVLQLGLYDPDYVDAYYGPPEWKPAATEKKIEPFPYAEFDGKANNCIEELVRIGSPLLDPPESRRHAGLMKQFAAIKAEIFFLSGGKLTFDQESELLYDAIAPVYSETHFKTLLGELDMLLPGKGPVSPRLENFRQPFIIPKQKLDPVFTAAISEGRRRTLEHIALPAGERFSVEYVNNKPWSGYNWYKGNSYSLIQVNTDLPIFIERAIDLACHEGYPGHHVYNLLLEKNLMKERGWMEYCVYPLFSPQSLIAEGSANFGIEVAFPGSERSDFEKKILFPLAGIDPARTEEYYKVYDVTQKMSYAGNEAARNYLDGKMRKNDAIEWLITYGLFAPDRAEQRLRFIEKYRSYVINYNLGLDLVRSYIEKGGGIPQNPIRRWQLFEELLSEPHTPSELG
jgi:hypothetical protein